LNFSAKIGGLANVRLGSGVTAPQEEDAGSRRNLGKGFAVVFGRERDGVREHKPSLTADQKKDERGLQKRGQWNHEGHKGHEGFLWFHTATLLSTDPAGAKLMTGSALAPLWPSCPWSLISPSGSWRSGRAGESRRQSFRLSCTSHAGGSACARRCGHRGFPVERHGGGLIHTQRRRAERLRNW
jgi:hypothetical protein